MPFPLLAIPIIGDLIRGVSGIIDKAVLDKDKAEALKAEINMQAAQLDYSSLDREIEKRAEVLVAEIRGESWLQRNWRPLLMVTCIIVVANNYIVAPYARALGFTSVELDLPEQLWNLMTLGVGGYIFGRSGEKIVETLGAAYAKKNGGGPHP